MASSRFDDPRRFDVRAFVAQGAEWAGRAPLGTLTRLADGTVPQPADGPQWVNWQAQGELRTPLGGTPEHWLRLQGDVQVHLVCQRCLGPVAERVWFDRWFRLADDESTAAQLDAELEDDVLAMPRQMDLLDLVEDELLMALPLVPRHAVCPEPLPLPADEQADEPAAEAAPHPFAALAALKGQLKP